MAQEKSVLESTHSLFAFLPKEIHRLLLTSFVGAAGGALVGTFIEDMSIESVYFSVKEISFDAVETGNMRLLQYLREHICWSDTDAYWHAAFVGRVCVMEWLDAFVEVGKSMYTLLHAIRGQHLKTIDFLCKKQAVLSCYSDVYYAVACTIT